MNTSQHPDTPPLFPTSALYSANMGSTETQTDLTPDFRYIPLSYSHADSQASALRLILTLNPDWEGPGNNVQFVRFTDGITNTVRLP